MLPIWRWHCEIDFDEDRAYAILDALSRLPGKAGVLIDANVVPAGLGCFTLLFAEINTLIGLMSIGSRT